MTKSWPHTPFAAEPAAVFAQAPKAREAAAALRTLPDALWQAVAELGGFYGRDYEVGLNLHADARRVKNYLGTYLPRTMFEAQTIAAELLALPMAQAMLPKDRPVRVLDLGSGTGGAWMGVANALHAVAGVHSFEVFAVDGNAEALAQQEALTLALADHWGADARASAGVEITLHLHEQVLSAEAATYVQELGDVLAAAQESVGGDFDFVLVSKHFNELYQMGSMKSWGLIPAALRVLDGALHPSGYMLVLEVTSQVCGGYFPLRLNRELAQFEAEQPSVRTVLPQPCALFAASGCGASAYGGCFTQRIFNVPMQIAGAGPTIATKLAYRVLSKAQHAMWLKRGFDAEGFYSLNAAKPDMACHKGRWQLHKRAA